MKNSPKNSLVTSEPITRRRAFVPSEKFTVVVTHQHENLFKIKITAFFVLEKKKKSTKYEKSDVTLSKPLVSAL